MASSSDAPEHLFVVQKHAARRLHYDLRLELGGVLLSWAVPQGFSLDPAQKHLAVQTEDHPVEYADYEGVIPDGNYGAGPSILWDRGSWIALEPPEDGLVSGKLLFELRGYKLRGVWTLVRTKRAGQDAGREWLLIKKPDGFARAEPFTFPEESIVSGLTVEELPAARERLQAVRDDLAAAGAKVHALRLESLKLMLAELGDTPFSDPNWIFELKWDGFRLIAAREDGRVQLRYRRGNDATSFFPEITQALSALPYRGLILDGEVVVVDDDGHPVFQRLQKRAQITRAADVARAALEHPVTYYAFDLLAFEGLDLRSLPLTTRKAALRRLLPARGPVRFADDIAGDGTALWEEVQRRGLEGIVAKRAASPYRAGRSADWIKVRVERTGDFVVVGLTPPERTRVGFGALHLAGFDGGALVYVGRAGSGFTQEQLVSLSDRLLADRCRTPPCGGATPKGHGQMWVTPRFAVEVRYKDWTEEGLLRQPVFLRLRDDKPLEECLVPSRRDETAATETARVEPDPFVRRVRLTNPKKVFWPEDGLTKGDLVEYYRWAAPLLLPYLRDRPVVLTRYPDGIHGKSFFQVDAPGFTPGWVRTHRVFNEDAGREVDVFVCDDVETLVYLANSATLPLHLWASRVGRLSVPDWCLLDLDPKRAPFADVIDLALAAEELCRSLGLPVFVKTSGQSGLHLLIPLGGQCTYEQCRTLAQLLARTLVDAMPEIATLTRTIDARGERVYIDWLQNGYGRLMAAPFCVRARPGAPVSTPLLWKEVTPDLDPSRFTIRTLPERFARLESDPMHGALTESPDLLAALARLAARLG